MFGDTVVTLPAAAAIIAWLVIGRAWRMAFWWGFLFSLGLFIVLATKVAFIGWGIGIEALDFTGISGHAMRASAVFPVMAYLLLQRSAPQARNRGIAAGIGIGLLIGVSRLLLHTHSVSEMMSGALLGTAIALGFIRMATAETALQLNRWLVAASMCALMPTSYAEPAPTNDWVNAIALYLSGHDKPYVRYYGNYARPVFARYESGQLVKWATALPEGVRQQTETR